MYGDFSVPVMYQDLANYSMPFFPPMPIGGIGYPSYLGGIQMQPQLDADRVQLMKKKDEEGKKTFKKALTALAVISAVIIAPSLVKNIKKAGGITGYVKKQRNALKNLFKTKPATP